MNRKPRIGEKMKEVVAFVRQNPGCAKLPAAEHVGPHGSRRYGYEIVDRAIRAQLICAERNDCRYSLYVNEHPLVILAGGSE